MITFQEYISYSLVLMNSPTPLNFRNSDSHSMKKMRKANISALAEAALSYNNFQHSHFIKRYPKIKNVAVMLPWFRPVSNSSQTEVTARINP